MRHVRFGGGPSEKARRTAGPRWRPTQFIAHGRRELVHVNVTANPAAAWVWRQVIEATPWGQKPRHLLRDRDAVYGATSAGRLDASVSMPSLHAFDRRVRSGHSAENAWTT
jgi:hypothetical protein